MTKFLDHKPINIAIIAMGGQGGGVLSKWIIDLAEAQGYLAQYTSVPGVAQRTGATIYYIELFAAHQVETAKKQPILALTPAVGDVDIVIASEMMEAGRALIRGFVNEKTTFLASSHRDYTIIEKQELGDGRRETDDIFALSKTTAKKFICFDMDSAARDQGAVISSVLFGALAGSNALPFAREKFEETITATGKSVPANLKGFAAGFERTQSDVQISVAAQDGIADPKARGVGAELIERMKASLPGHAMHLAYAAMQKLSDYQDLDYAKLYLEKLEHFADLDEKHGGKQQKCLLTQNVARYLALAMSYDDIIRVADLKTRQSRFTNFRSEVNAAEGQIINVSEYMHPRWQEICEIMPARLGSYFLNSGFWTRVFSPFFKKGRRIGTTKLPGFLMLFLMGRLRWLRRSSLRFTHETKRISNWLGDIENAAPQNYDLACEIAGMQRLIKGYGDTHERGLRNSAIIMKALDGFRGADDAPQQLAMLKQAALKDDEGLALSQALNDQKIIKQAA